MDKAVKFAFMVKAEYNKYICVSAIQMVREIAGKNAKKDGDRRSRYDRYLCRMSGKSAKDR